MAAEEPQSWAWVLYAGAGRPLWHQRWVAGRVASTAAEFVVRTPDDDEYTEVYDGTSDAIAAVRW